MTRRILASLLSLVLTAAGALSASASTITGIGYVVTKDTVSVIVPTALDFAIDPYEIHEKGSIYSDEYLLANRGDSEVLLTFTSIEVVFANETDFVQSKVPIDNSVPGGPKTAYMVLDFGSPNIAPIVLTDPDRAQSFAVILGEKNSQHSRYSLSVHGGVNSDPDIEWMSGDIRITVTYKFESVVEDEGNGDAENPNTSDDIDDADADETPQTEEPAVATPGTTEDNGIPAGSSDPTDPGVTENSNPATDPGITESGYLTEGNSA